MVRVPPHRWPHVLFAACIAGASIAVLRLDLFAGRLFSQPQIGLAAALALLALVCIGLSIFYPRRRIAILAVSITFLAYFITNVLFAEWRFWHWTPSFLYNQIPPPVPGIVFATLLISFSMAHLIRPWRIVAPPRVESPCPRCGYSRAALITQPCPECGTLEPITPPRSLDS